MYFFDLTSCGLMECILVMSLSTLSKQGLSTFPRSLNLEAYQLHVVLDGSRWARKSWVCLGDKHLGPNLDQRDSRPRPIRCYPSDPSHTISDPSCSSAMSRPRTVGDQASYLKSPQQQYRRGEVVLEAWVCTAESYYA